MANLFSQGPSQGEQFASFYEQAYAIPPQERSFIRIMSIAQQLGSSDPAKRAQEFFKTEKDERTRIKEMLPSVPESTVPTTPQILDLLTRADLPTTGLHEPAPLSAPFGRSAETGLPVTLPQMMEMVPGLRQAIDAGRLPGPMVQSQPELTLFGQGAREALPQQPIPGSFVPSTLITAAAGRLGEPKLPSVGTDLEGISLSLYDKPFSKLAPDERQNVRVIDQREKVRQRAAEGAGSEIAKLNIDLRSQRSHMSNFVSGIGKVQDIVEQNPSVLGVPGGLSRAITSVADQAKAMANLIMPGAYEEFHKVERYANIFRATGIESAELQSRLLGLAIGMAFSEGFQGREITDRKIQLNLNRLTGAIGSGSAEIAFNTLEQLKQEVVTGFNTSASATATGVEDVLGPVPGLAAPKSRQFLGVPKPTGGLPPGIPKGSKYVGTIDGKPAYDTPDGKRVIIE